MKEILRLSGLFHWFRKNIQMYLIAERRCSKVSVTRFGKKEHFVWLEKWARNCFIRSYHMYQRWHLLYSASLSVKSNRRAVQTVITDCCIPIFIGQAVSRLDNHMVHLINVNNVDIDDKTKSWRHDKNH